MCSKSLDSLSPSAIIIILLQIYIYIYSPRIIIIVLAERIKFIQFGIILYNIIIIYSRAHAQSKNV